MSIFLKRIALFALLAAGLSSVSIAAQTATQDMKNAGHDTADATKQTAHKTARATKKGTNKAARGTKRTANKVEQKTDTNNPK